MKICMVTLDSPVSGIRDGITSHVYHLSKNLGVQGHQVWVVALNPDVNETVIHQDENVTNVSIPCRKRSLFMKMMILHKEASKIIINLDNVHKFDVFHGHGGYISPIVAYKTDSLKILTLHNTFEYDKYLESDYLEKKNYIGWLKRKLFYPSFLLKHYRKWYYDSVSHIISVTKHNADKTSKHFNVPIEKFTIIPNGFDVSEIPDTTNNTGSNQVLYFGRLEPHKGAQVLIKAFNIINEIYPSLVLGIAGDGDYKPHLERQVKDYGLGEIVKFYGRLDRKTLFDQIDSSKVIVIPSYFEGIPVALFEAAAMSKPLIISELPGVKEILDSSSCMFFKPGDSQDLASRIVWMIDNPGKAHILGLNANKMVKSKYNWDSIAINTLKVYDKIVYGEDSFGCP